MKQQRLENRVDEISARLNAVEQYRNADEKSKRPDSQTQEIIIKISRLEGAVSVVAIVFVLVSGLGLWKLYQYQNFVAARDEVYELLVNQLRERTSNAINKLTITGNTQEQKTRINELVGLKRSLVTLRVNTQSFVGTSDLIVGLERIVPDEKLDDATIVLKSLESRFPRDEYIRSRVLTLLALIEIARHREDFLPEVKKSLLEAIRLDSTVALACNAVGIQTTNQAKVEINKGKLEEATLLMKEADIYYGMAADLDTSVLGIYRYINNKIWGNLLLFNAYLKRAQPLDNIHRRNALDDILNYLKNKNADEFFDDVKDQLETYKILSPGLPVAIETEAQYLCVKAQYSLLYDMKLDPDKLLEQAVDLFLQVIDKGLYLWVRTPDEAIEQFRNNPLHKPIVESEKYRNIIYDRIKNRHPMRSE